MNYPGKRLQTVVKMMENIVTGIRAGNMKLAGQRFNSAEGLLSTFKMGVVPQREPADLPKATFAIARAIRPTQSPQRLHFGCLFCAPSRSNGESIHPKPGPTARAHVRKTPNSSGHFVRAVEMRMSILQRNFCASLRRVIILIDPGLLHLHKNPLVDPH